jgi:histidyl-tRNA synthetase
MTESLKAPKGTFDVLPPDGQELLRVRSVLGEHIQAAGYSYIETPTFEDTSLFVRGVGQSTDVVSKEMYSFTTKGDDDLTLRPEGTASVMRAVLEHGIHKGALPAKLWYSGSFYRYERPQAGRFRHFSQVGAEAIGSNDPVLDAELIVVAMDSFKALGLKRVNLLLNSLGDSSDRPAYRQALVKFLSGLDLDEATRERAAINPLRVLDDKREAVRAQLVDAPVMTDFLSVHNRAHFDKVQALLTSAGIEWTKAPHLVRGLDYYTRTAFEFVHDGLGAQSAVGGGGRYDGLSGSLGGPDLPSVGWAIGVDRTLLAMRAEEVLAQQSAVPVVDVFAVPIGQAASDLAFDIVTALRRSGISADLAVDGRGLKGAMKSADRTGAKIAIVMGERDLEQGVVQLKTMETGEQVSVPIADAVSGVISALKSAPGRKSW